MPGPEPERFTWRSARASARRGRPFLVGHRGYKARFPENTLLAFRAALEAGAHGIECDVQRSADGRYVVIHDPPRERDQEIPTLEAVLQWLPAAACIDVELKEETLSVADAERIARIFDRFIDRDRLMVSSFKAELLVPLKAMGFTVALLVGEEARGLGPLGLLARIAALRPAWVNLPVQAFGVLGRARAMAFCRLLRALGARLLFWTVNTREEAALLRPVADAIVTDEVELLRP